MSQRQILNLPRPPIGRSSPNSLPDMDHPPILDADAFPGIIGAILNFSDHRTQIALWGTSRSLYNFICTRIYRNVVHYCGGLGPCKDARFPVIHTGDEEALGEVLNNIETHGRTVDLMSLCAYDMAADSVDLIKTSGRPVTLRIGHLGAMDFDLAPTTVIFLANYINTSTEDWLTWFTLLQPTLPPGITRVVVNIGYHWADQVFASEVGLEYLPDTVTEVVFHFKKIDAGERPCAVVARRGITIIPDEDGEDDNESVDGADSDDWSGCSGDTSSQNSIDEGNGDDDESDIDTNGSDTSGSSDADGISSGDETNPLEAFLSFHSSGSGECEFIDPVYMDKPIPQHDGILKHIHLVAFPQPQDRLNMFDSIAHMWSNSLVKRKYVGLKLTLVGVGEFDEVREDEAAGDEALGVFLDKLAWGGNFPDREEWAHTAPEPVSTTFIDGALKLVPQDKRDAFKNSIQVLSTNEYLSKLAPQDCQNEEGWWGLDAGNLEPC